MFRIYKFKDIRLTYGYGWWEDEHPSDEIKQYVERQLKKWYCVHYHTEKKIDCLEIMFGNIEEFGV